MIIEGCKQITVKNFTKTVLKVKGERIMKKKNLEKAIILGLMAASISVPVWAADVSIENFKNSADGSNVITVNEEKTVIGTGVYGTDLGSGLTENTFWKDTNTFYTINVGNTASLTLQNVNTYGPYITGNGNIEINISDPQSPAGLIAGIAVSGYIQGNSLIINATNEDGKDIKGINTGGSNAYTVNNHDVTVDVADSVRINSQSDGIFTAQDTEADVNITAGKGILIDAETRNGIYNAGNVIESDKVNNINLTSDSGDIIIFSNSNDETSAGVKSKNFGAISLTSNQGNIVIGQQDAKGKYTTVNSNTNGIYAAAGNVTLNAGMDNLIYATTTGTYATGAGTVVTLSAENNGIYVNNNSGEPGGIAKGVYAFDGATKKIVSEGNTTITAEGNVRDIMGIHADAGGTVDIDAGSLNIKATANDANVDNYLSGILAGDINQNVDTDNATVIADVDGDIHVDIYSAGTDSYGIKTNKNGNVDLTSHEGNITINALDNVEAYTGATKYGIHTGLGGQTTLVAENGSISVNAGDSKTYRGNNHGIHNGGEMLIDAKENVSIGSYSYGDPSFNAYGSGIDVAYGTTTIKAGKNFVLDSISSTDFEGSKNYGAQLSKQSIIDIDAANVTIKSKGNISTAIYEYGASKLNIDAVSNNEINGIIEIQAEAGSGQSIAMFMDRSTAELNAYNDIKIKATSAESDAMGAYVNKSIVDLNSEKGSTSIISQGTKDGYGIRVQTSAEENSEMTVASAVNNYVKSSGTGIASWYDNSVVNLTAETGSNQVQANSYGIYNFGGAQTSMTADNGFNTVSSQNSYAVYNNGAAGNVVLQAQGNSVTGYHGIVGVGGNIDLTAATVNNELTTVNNELTAEGNGIYATTKADVDLSAEQGINYLEAGASGIAADIVGIYADDSTVDLQAKANTLNIAADADGYGSRHAVKAANQAIVNLNATAGNNEVAGVIYAKDEGTVVTLDHNITDKNGDIVGKGSGNNIIMSSAHGSNDTVGNRQKVVAALYAQSNGKIDISAGNGGVNYIATEFNFNTTDTTEEESERTIWAQQGGKINIEGQTFIIASNADKYTENVAGNAKGIAITAGSETIPTEGIDTTNGSIIDIKDELRSNVTLAYNGSDSGLHSFIKGDIVSGYGGLVDVYNTDNSGLDMMGNALAANGGKLNLDIGNGGTWYGRADDYGDAGIIKDGEHTTFFDPAFSNKIVQGGQVNLTMGEGSRWNVTGQSWITSIKTGESDITAGTPIIDLVNANTDRNTTAHALTVYELDGNAIFNMNLDGDRDVSDMLYIKNADGEYVINVVDAVSVDDMYQDGFDGLRFATIGDGSNVSFRAITYNQGINNVEYEVGQDEYDGNEENNAYNSSETDGGMSSEKPGSDMVDDFFDSTGTPENPQGPDDTEIMTLENTVESDSNVNGTTNFKLIGVKNSEISDGGKTVVNMSKVNYSNAVYMDRLNKRLGEARYINNEEDQGMWVRMRHDRIGKDNEFRIMNTMYELGYDEKQECDNGERRVGAAIDYMDGSSEYTGVGGSGDVSRKGIWLYDTWLGDKGHYSDFVAKWGHLSNDFTLYRGGDKITGDFSNNVYSISAEYGRKKDIGNNWYFEPQVQLQYARVTDANYTTSQGTEVSLDAINSLIARAGFRLGKDLGERSTVYFKADLLHEFLGDQDIYATDGTGTMDVTYGNEGTWYDVGFGFAAKMSKNSYAFMDFEKSFGNDNDETYQINAGMQWSF